MPVEITWWGHATCTVEDSGARVLTDPLFARRLAHLRRRRGAPPPPEAAVADVALVSHLHADHLHVPSLARLAPGTRLLVPKGTPRAVPGLRRLGHLQVTEMANGDRTRVGDLVVQAVPARHDGRRLPVGPHRAPALGYVIEGEARTYFAGDTGLFESMAKEVGPVDVALLPVGGWGPYLGEGHLDAGRAAEALTRLQPGSAVPVHYGTYWPIGMDAVRPHEFHAPGEEFVRLAAERAPEVAVHLLEHGQRVRPRVAGYRSSPRDAPAGRGDDEREGEAR
ncbi:MBL fold metallo-hydrolase [Streptomyces sp. NPDC050597]|uniref:MBL fold metallo-hydrolase n=1 Tax=Streptomyces sp. NPDC050597 TaxID=3157212 RepID=UPI00117CEFE2|nr:MULTISPECIES: MBL fold metallo-hydrolase [Streptomyces]TRO60902.1 MBL fold metallo-hydrolase [Streptomyces sp. IB201691-2A2]